MVIDATWIPLGFALALKACMLWVVVSDVAHYIIPNTLNALIVALFIAAACLLPGASLMALAAAALVLVVGLGLFSLGLMGGGDIKLLVALSLWTGWGMPTLQFIFMTAMFGGLLVVVVLLARLLLPPLWRKFRAGRALPRILTRREPVPYGIALALAFWWVLEQGQVALLGA